MIWHFISSIQYNTSVVHAHFWMKMFVQNININHSHFKCTVSAMKLTSVICIVTLWGSHFRTTLNWKIAGAISDTFKKHMYVYMSKDFNKIWTWKYLHKFNPINSPSGPDRTLLKPAWFSNIPSVSWKIKVCKKCPGYHEIKPFVLHGRTTIPKLLLHYLCAEASQLKAHTKQEVNWNAIVYQCKMVNFTLWLHHPWWNPVRLASH
jgi:hypothetical protein